MSRGKNDVHRDTERRENSNKGGRGWSRSDSDGSSKPAKIDEGSTNVLKQSYGNDWNLGDYERGSGNEAVGKSTDHHDQKKARKVSCEQRFEGAACQEAE